MKNYRSIFPFLFVLTLVVSAARVRAERLPKPLGVREQALVKAVMAKDTPAILALLKAGADPNTEYSYQGPTAADPFEHETRTSPLLYHVLGWYTGSFCGEGFRHYEESIFDCDLSVVKAFLDAGANADPGHEGSLLAFAAQHSDPAVVAMLLKHGADVRTANGCTVLMGAAENNRAETLKLLLAHGVKANGADARFGRTALHRAVAGTNWEMKENPAQTATIRLLLDHGADANAVDKFGTSVLAWAATFHNVEGIKLLLAWHGKKPVTDTPDQPALLAAVDTPCYDPPQDPTRQIETIRLLLDAGANIDVADSAGLTALIRASGAGNTELVRFLIRRNANLKALDKDGKAAIDWARARKHFAIVSLLEQAGANE